VLSVASYVGTGAAASGIMLEWPLDTATPHPVFVDGAAVLTFTAGAGHAYEVYLDASATAAIVDRTAEFTGWFWYGFAFVFAAGLMGIGAGWVRKILGGWAEPGGD